MNHPCEVQWKGVCHGKATNRHHRLLRKNGGTDDPVNIIYVCGSGTTGCHGKIHSEPRLSYEAGLLCHSWDRPGDVEVKAWMVQ